MLSKIDPKSLAGRLLLMAIDKMIIGALIGGAILAYDIFKTKEIRTYNETREEIQLSFKRAEYLEKLLPIVLDRKQQTLVRAHALGSLIGTQATDPYSAVSFANKILLDDKERVLDREGNFLLERLLGVMPAGMPSIIRQYTRNKNFLSSNPDNVVFQSHISWVNWFWRSLMYSTIQDVEDAKLSLMNSNTFLVNNLRNLSYMIPLLKEPEARVWANRSVKGVRILGNISLLQEGEIGPKEDDSASAYLLNLTYSRDGAFIG